MTGTRDPEKLIAAFLDEGRDELPDRTYEVVRSQIDRTRQRVVIGPWKEPRMTNFARIGIAAAAVVVAAVIGVNLMSGQGQVASPNRSAAPTPLSSPVALPAASLAAGTTYRTDGIGSLPVTFTVPGNGWFAIDTSGILGKDVLEPKRMYDVALSTWEVGGVYADPCHWATSNSPVVGPTVDDLATALVAQKGRSASQPVAVTVGGYAGKKVELTLPATYDIEACDSGDFKTWTELNGNGYGGYIYGPGQKNSIYILNVAGKRLVIDTMYLPGTSPADLVELEQIVGSIHIEP